MVRVLALHLSEHLALPPEENLAESIQRHLVYKEHLEYYCIITKTLAARPYPPYTPLENMEVLPTNSKNRYLFLKDAYNMASRVIEQHQIDVITVQDWRWLGLVGLLLRRKYRVALNLQLHNQVYNNPYYRRESFDAWLGDKFARFVIPRADTWWVGTEDQKVQLLRRGLPPGRIFHTSYSIPPERFYEASGSHIRSQFQKEGFAAILLWVGRMVKQKDLDTLIQSVKLVIEQYPDTVLLLLGNGPERSRFESKVKHLNLEKNICFCGYIPYEQVPSYYAAADIVCVSSLYEGTCRLIHEGMAAAKPIVSTDVGGALDAIQDGKTGYIVPRRSPEKFAEAILRLIENKDLAQRMGQAGRIYHAEHFSMEHHYQTFIRMWEVTSLLTQRMQRGV